MTINLGKNLSDIETEETYGPMPVGDYKAVVVEAIEKVSQSGNDMIELQIKLEGNERYDGKLFWRYLVFGLEYSLEALKRDMTCLGMNTDNVTTVSAEQFINRRCRVHTKREEYNGELKDKIHYLKPYESSSGSPATSDEEPLPEEPQGVSDDDIPF
ncbi:MAG: hypothetical protein M1455_06300 [Actinobacteria bacterium]|nr:hypothetical protein [Actinomycetota bacterium]